MSKTFRSDQHGDLQVPDNFAELPEADQQKILQQAAKIKNTNIAPMSATRVAGGVLDEALQGLTLYSSDEIGGAASEVLNIPKTIFTDQEFGDAYNRRVTKKRQDYKDFQQAYPKTAVTSNIVGSVAPIGVSLLLGGPAGGTSTIAPTLARTKGILDSSRLLAGGMTKPGARLAEKTAEGFKMGAAQGAFAGVAGNESDAESIGGVIADKGTSGLFGGITGAAIGTALPPVVQGSIYLGNKLLLQPIIRTAQNLSKSNPTFTSDEIVAIKDIGKLFLNDEISTEQIINQIKKNVSADKLEGVTPVEILADYAGDAVKRKLRGMNIVTPGTKISSTLTERGSGTVEQKGANILEGEQSNIQSTRVASSLDESVKKTIKTKGINLSDGVDEIQNAIQKKLSPLYTKAFDENKTVSNLELYKFLEVPTIKNAYKAAKDAYLLETQKLNPGKSISMDDLGIPDVKDLFIKNAEGRITGVTKELPLIFLDQIKRAADAKTFALKTTTGSNKIDQRTVELRKDVANQFRDLLKNSVKGNDYANVLKQASDRFALGDAFEIGAKLRKKSIKLDAFKTKFNSLKTDAEKDAFRMGVFEEILNDINTTTDTANLSKKLLDTPALANKIKILFTDIPGGAEAFINRLIREDKIARTNQTVLGGSNTAEKQIDASPMLQNLSDAVVALTAPTSSAGIRAEATLTNKAQNVLFDKSGRERRAFLNTMLNQNPKTQIEMLNLMEQLQRQSQIESMRSNFARSSLIRNASPYSANATQDFLSGINNDTSNGENR
jgi:hypothetical protein